MDKQQARTIIKETCEEPFNKDRFNGFIKNLLNQIEDAPFIYQGNYIPEAYKPFISRYERIGKYNDGEKRIDILIVYLSKETSIERARTRQRNFIAGYLDGKYGSDVSKDAALVAFVAPNEEDWRFSLVKMDYRFEQAKNGKVKVKEEFTPARRWSFLVGKNESSHTAQSRLVDTLADDEHNPTLAEMEEAFNIERVTKEFFEKYRELFLWTKETLDGIVENNSKIKSDFEAKGVSTVDFAKKFLGQIVFLYFLQKKGWFGVPRDAEWGMGSKKFLRDLFKGKHGNYTNFFNDILEPLFYEALRIDRRHDDDYYSRFNCKIPFLNGGLFDPIGGYDWVHTDILLPNELFSNQNKTKEGDTGNGILDIFDRYNFTVKEDEPLEKEVAIDPEMLGKVFENLLEVKDRKSKGTYYTPREIVHYMCQQSLINYLATELSSSVIARSEATKQSGFPTKEDIETFIKYGEQFGENEATVEAKGKETDTYSYKLPENIRKYAKLIDDKLANIKVCDPAIGSGAFPVGMMHEIVKTRNVLTTFLSLHGGAKATKQSHTGDRFADACDGNRTIYHFKRQCIEKSLYGVDIDPGAVEIAKLRLWLSLVVDEEDIKQIKPLPNLDYKIVHGNSLLGVEKNLFNNQLFAELERLKPFLFNETNPTRKQEYKQQIDELISQITNGHKEFDFEVYFSEVFHEKKGFDVVIANPPYIDSEGMINSGQRDLRETIVKTYKMTKGNWDIYIAFFELGFNILNTNGVLTYITPDKWISKSFGDALRKNTINNIYSILKAGREIFENSKVDSIVSVFRKSHCSELNILHFVNKQIIFKSEIDKKILKPPFKFDFIFSNQLNFLIKFEMFPNKISDISNCENACATSDAYKLKPLIEDLLSKYEFDRNTQLKIINTGTVGKYVSKWGIKEMTYLRNKFLFPVVSKKEFFNLFTKSYSKKVIRPKIIIKGLNLLDVCLDFYGTIIPGKTTLIIADHDVNKLKLLLSILNSKLAIFYLKEKYPSSSYNLGINFTKDMINNFPIPKIKKAKQKSFIEIVNRILAISKDDDYHENLQKQAYVKTLEREIDQMVYRLYILTEEEIRTVEGDK